MRIAKTLGRATLAWFSSQAMKNSCANLYISTFLDLELNTTNKVIIDMDIC
jgi:hypothetical protein